MYLTKNSKKYYADALNEVEKFDDIYWGLDLHSKPFIEEINKNLMIQTIYSTFAKRSNGMDLQSYLTISFSHEVELLIYRAILPDIIYYFNNKGNQYSTCHYSYNKPTIYKHLIGKDVELKCRDDANYFNIHNIRISLNGGNLELHQEFWQNLSNSFKKLSKI